MGHTTCSTLINGLSVKPIEFKKLFGVLWGPIFHLLLGIYFHLSRHVVKDKPWFVPRYLSALLTHNRGNCKMRWRQSLSVIQTLCRSHIGFARVYWNRALGLFKCIVESGCRNHLLPFVPSSANDNENLYLYPITHWWFRVSLSS